MNDDSNGQVNPLIAFVTCDNAPQIIPAPITRTWMTEMRQGWPNRCLPMLIANQSGWEAAQSVRVHRDMNGWRRQRELADRARQV